MHQSGARIDSAWLKMSLDADFLRIFFFLLYYFCITFPLKNLVKSRYRKHVFLDQMCFLFCIFEWFLQDPTRECKRQKSFCFQCGRHLKDWTSIYHIMGLYCLNSPNHSFQIESYIYHTMHFSKKCRKSYLFQFGCICFFIVCCNNNAAYFYLFIYFLIVVRTVFSSKSRLSDA